MVQAANFYKCSCLGLHEKIEPSNTEAGDLARRIFEIHDRIDVLRVVLLSDGMAGLKSGDLKTTKDGTRVLVDMYGIERLHRVLGEGLTRDDIFLDFKAETGAALPCLRACSEGADYDAYLTVPGALLADIYEKYGTHLLNLMSAHRSACAAAKSVNAGLRRTIQEEPARFLAYNNGIVATADEIDILDERRDGMLAIKALRGLQILNGGQTTASLHRARKQGQN